MAGDYACDEHEREVARNRPRVACGHPEHVFPDEARLSPLPARAAEDILTRQRDLGIGDAELPQVT